MGVDLVLDLRLTVTAQCIESGSHGVDLLGRMTDPVDKLANDAQRLPATEGLRRIPRELLVGHVRVVLELSGGLDDARTEDDYTTREWVEAPGVRYVPVDGELELLPGLRLVPAPGHTRGMQVVVVETGGRPVVVGGDVAVWFGELDEPHTEGQLRVRALDPELVWLAHEHEPWRPRTV